MPDRKVKMRGVILKKFFFLLVWLALSPNARAEVLPLRSFTAADGLATSIIQHAAQDSNGFLWFSGRGGLSRYDGTEFVVFEFSETETAPLVHCFLESRDGRFFWIADDNGLYRVERGAAETVEPTADARRAGGRRMRAKRVSRQSFWVLHETADGRFFGGSADDLYSVGNRAADEVTLTKLGIGATILGEKESPSVRKMADGADGSVWIGTDLGLVRILPDNRRVIYRFSLIARDQVFSVHCDRTGAVWTAFASGIFVLRPESAAESANLPNEFVRMPAVRIVEIGDGGSFEIPQTAGELVRLDFAANKVPASGGSIAATSDLIQTTDGKIWIPTKFGLYVWENGAYRRFRDANGLPGAARGIVEDRAGNVWFGGDGGLIRFKRDGLTSYKQNSGLPDAAVGAITETSGGDFLAMHGNWRVSRLTAAGFETETLKLPSDARIAWTAKPVLLDTGGTLWALTNAGLWEFPARDSFAELLRQTPRRIEKIGELDVKDKTFYRAFEDRSGNIWISFYDATGRKWLVRYAPPTGEWKIFSEADGFPAERLVASFAEDAAGNLWLGFYGASGLLKFSGGRFTPITAEEGDLTAASTLALHFDRRGRLWIASTEKGLARVDEPAAERLKFTRYTQNEGLTSDNVRSLTEDANGEIYAGTVRGISRINPENGEIKQITTADGLAGDFVTTAFRDKRGALWFGTANGLSRFEPSASIKAAAPAVFISDLQIAGVNYAVSEFGQTAIGGISVASAENNLRINFTSVGEAVRYQFKLEGADNAAWSEPNAERAVNFANLAPGEYKFLVLAVGVDGAASEHPAAVAFTIRPPFWRTTWFLLLSTILVCAVLLAIYRYRTENLRRVNHALTEAKRAEEDLSRARKERLTELEKVRARIATDLHDDIGSSLSQISLYSELARQRERESGSAGEQLDMISGVADELVDTMSDIVWAINPKKDHLQDLTQRMRRFAANVLTAKDIDLEFLAPASENETPLGANIRREVFLIFKETVNNIVKHSAASEAKIEFLLIGSQLVISFEDNGKGFNPSAKLSENGHHDWKKFRGGNGLANMRKRAVDLGGEYEIKSEPNKGTIVIVSIPLELRDQG